ncbi:MAG: prefoldin subunit [Nanoarchaeota archaeon]
MNKDGLKQFQILEQSLQAVHMQKQQFHAQLIELESALAELAISNTAYKIVGNIMVSSKKEDLKKDLEEKKEVFSARMKVLEKQEQKYSEEAGKLQKELMKGMKE